MNPMITRLSFALLGLAAGLPALAHDYPTVDRVLYVQDCMNSHPGPYYEMVNKCSCALDALAREVPFDDYTSMMTVTRAMSIGGERGNTIRDTEPLQAQAKRYRELQSKAQSGCFLGPPARQ